MEEFKRQIAKKVTIIDLQNGEYVRQEGWQSNFVQIPSGDKVSRINIIGTVVSDQNAGNIAIDDGTGRIDLRAFDDSFSIPQVQIGQVVMVIGKPREFGSEVYLLPEIVKPIEDKNWIQVRLKELKRTPLQETTVNEPVNETLPSMQDVYEIIKDLDKGEGANTEDVLQKLSNEKTEEIIQKLLREGEIFEIAPGKLKNS